MAQEITDKCGNPLPQVCPPQTVLTPICYLTPALYNAGVCCGLPGFLQIVIGTDCAAESTAILDAEQNTVPTGYQVPCPSTLGGGDIAFANCPPPPAGGS